MAMLLAVMSFWACDTAVGPLDGTGDSTITLTLAVTEARVFEGQTTQLELTVRRGGTVVNATTAGITISWRSADPSIASVDTKGLLEGIAEGQTRIVASTAGLEVSASVTVVPGAQSIEVLTTKLVGVVGETLEGGVRLRVKGRKGGNIAGITVRFQVLSGGGTVAPTEVITDSKGRADVQWTLGPVAGDQELDVVAQFAAGASASAASAGASSAPGKGVERKVKVKAKPASPKTAIITPESAQLATHDELGFQVHVEDKFGNEVTDAGLVWSVSDLSVITVSDVGMVYAVAPGSAEVVASAVGLSVSGSAQVEVSGTVNEPTITTTSMPAGTVGTAYSQTLAATDGDGSYTWAMFNGTTLPAGLSLNAGTGEISGTPTAAGTTNFEVEVTSAGQTATKALQITIGAAAPSITTSSPMPNGTVGVAYSQTLAATGGAGSYTWAMFNATTLPTGLSLDAATGEISGTPTASGVTNFEVEVTSAGQTATKALSITINNNSPGQVTDLAVLSTAPTSVTLTFTEVNDGTGSPASYEIRYATPPMGWSSATVVAQGTCASPLSGVAIGASLTCLVEGLNAAASYDFQLVAFRGTPAANAVFGQLSNVVTASTPAQNQLTINTASMLNGTVDVAYSQTLAATGGDGSYTWAMFNATTLPAGLGLNTATGEISGTPTAAGTTNFEVEVTSAGQTATKALSVTINNNSPGRVTDLAVLSTAPTSVTLTFTEVNDGTGSPAKYDIRYMTPPMSWGGATVAAQGTCATPLSGVAIGASLTCLVEGLNAAASYDFQLVSFRGILNVDAVFGQLSNVVTASTTAGPPPPPSITTSSPLPNGTVGVAYSQTLAATGGDGSYTWATFNSTTLPAGVSLNAGTGEISGTPTAAGTSNFEVEVTSAGQTGTKALPITIDAAAPPPPSITTSSPMPSGTVGVAYSQTLAATGGNGNYTWTMFNATTLIAGLVLNGATGEIHGTPTAAGTTNFEVEVTSAGQTATKALSMTIDGAAEPGGLVAHWAFDEGSGSATADLSGNGNTGSLVNDPTWTSGRVGGALDFDGADDHVVVANNASLDITGTAITITALIKPGDAGASAGSRIVSKRTDAGGSDVYALYTQQNRFRFRLDGTDLIAAGTFANDKWVFVAAVYDGTEKRIYINGVQDAATQAKTDAIDASTRAVHLGMREAEARHFNGVMDEVRIYDRALSAAEIQALDEAVPPPSPIITTTSLPNGLLAAAYSQTLAATDGDGNYTWAMFNATTLPAGLGLNTATGEISGTPTAAGTTNFEVEVTSAGQTATKALAITIDATPPPPSITTTSLSNGTVGRAYSQTLAATGGDGSYTWALFNATTLPAGLALNTAGAISGTPSAAGTTNFEVQVTSAGQTATKALSITINPVSPPPPGGTSEPMPGDPGASTIWFETFDSFNGIHADHRTQNQAPLLHDGSGFGRYGLGKGLDCKTLVPGRGGSTNSLLFTYSSNPGIGCDDILISKAVTKVDEFFIQYWFKTTPGHTPTEKSTSGVKWLLLPNDGGQGRYQNSVGRVIDPNTGCAEFENKFFETRMKHDFLSSNVEFDHYVWSSDPCLPPFFESQDAGGTPWPNGVNDGNWHRTTIHLKVGSYVKAWLDGVLVWDDEGAGNTYPGRVTEWKMFGNFTAQGTTPNLFEVFLDDLFLWTVN